jgi:hypothetical protein
MRINVAAISTYIGHFFSGGVDPTIPHLILILVVVAGGLLVGGGIIWEAARDGHLWALPTACVFIGVVAEAAATVILFEFDEGISQHQESIIEAQQAVIRSQNDKIIALERIIIPRHWYGPMNGSHLGGITGTALFDEMRIDGKLHEFPNVTALIQTIPQYEAKRFGHGMAVGLQAAGWTVKDLDTPQSYIGPYAILDGVQLWTRPERDSAWNAAEALAASLRYRNVQAESPKSPLHHDDPQNFSFGMNDIRRSIPAGSVVILIGEKPGFNELTEMEAAEYRAAHPNEK